MSNNEALRLKPQNVRKNFNRRCVDPLNYYYEEEKGLEFYPQNGPSFFVPLRQIKEYLRRLDHE